MRITTRRKSTNLSVSHQPRNLLDWSGRLKRDNDFNAFSGVVPNKRMHLTFHLAEFGMFSRSEIVEFALEVAVQVKCG